jgi:hypothetical protein
MDTAFGGIFKTKTAEHRKKEIGLLEKKGGRRRELESWRKKKNSRGFEAETGFTTSEHGMAPWWCNVMMLG